MVGAVIYVRVSTKEETENLSLTIQLRACERTRAGMRYLKWRLANAHPEPDVRYFSKALARASWANSITTSTRHGTPDAV